MIYLSTKSKIKPKRKTKAEREEYAAWCAKYGIDPEKKRTKKPKFWEVEVYKPEPRSNVRETKFIPSLDTGHTGAVTTGRKNVQYTGTKMIGVATMHKSNMVPIFNEESAVEVSQMRR